MKKSISPVLITFVFVSFVLLPKAHAVSPAPDGGYPGGNTAEGTNALFSLSTGIQNTATGFRTLYGNTEGRDNTGNGYQALAANTIGVANTATGSQALYRNTTGSSNTATGALALWRNTGGYLNTANGTGALYNNIGGIENTAIGVNALATNTFGNYNTAAGSGALYTNGTGSVNTAIGVEALENNTSGDDNVATGYRALLSNTRGQNNVANGDYALEGNRTGSGNTAIGGSALTSNQTANNNTAIGGAALVDNTTGANNTATGGAALASNQAGSNNTADGAGALLRIRGSNNIALGYNAGSNLTQGANNIDIGNAGVAIESGTTRIGTQATQTKTFIAGIYGSNEGGTILPVYINSNGQLGTQPPASAQRFKKQIKPMDAASERILALKPVTFQYKTDASGTPQFGLIAEEVAAVNPDLVVRDGNGEIYTVRYDAVNAMLLNEFLKEHNKVQKLEATVVQQQENFQSKLAEQQKQIDALTAGLQKVSAQLAAASPSRGGLEASGSAPQTAVDNRQSSTSR